MSRESTQICNNNATIPTHQTKVLHRRLSPYKPFHPHLLPDRPKVVRALQLRSVILNSQQGMKEIALIQALTFLTSSLLKLIKNALWSKLGTWSGLGICNSKAQNQSDCLDPIQGRTKMDHSHYSQTKENQRSLSISGFLCEFRIKLLNEIVGTWTRHVQVMKIKIMAHTKKVASWHTMFSPCVPSHSWHFMTFLMLPGLSHLESLDRHSSALALEPKRCISFEWHVVASFWKKSAAHKFGQQ